jgi:hypothetical protein
MIQITDRGCGVQFHVRDELAPKGDPVRAPVDWRRHRAEPGERISMKAEHDRVSVGSEGPSRDPVRKIPGLSDG